MVEAIETKESLKIAINLNIQVLVPDGDSNFITELVMKFGNISPMQLEDGNCNLRPPRTKKIFHEIRGAHVKHKTNIVANRLKILSVNVIMVHKLQKDDKYMWILVTICLIL